MKRFIASALAAAALFTACTAETSEAAEGTDAENDIVPSVEDIGNIDDIVPAQTSGTVIHVPENAVEYVTMDESAPILDRVNECIGLYEYGKAVELIENNPDICSDPAFDKAKSELKIHFTNTAKNFYTASATYVTKQEIMGYDYSTGFEGYDPEEKTLDPHVLEELMNYEDKVVLNRTKIDCHDDYSFKVTIDFCGMTAVYPAEDVRLQ